MTKVKHTPGPWICHSGMVWKPDGSEYGYPIALMERNTEKTIPTERDANAHLIAAAPELLAALQSMVELAIDLGAHHRGEFEQAHAAIFKATAKD